MKQTLTAPAGPVRNVRNILKRIREGMEGAA